MRLPEDFSGARDDSHLVELWLSGRPETTRESYEYTWKSFAAFLAERKIGLRETKVADVVAWIETLQGAVSSQGRHVSVLKSLLTYAHQTGYTVFNVGKAIRCPKQPDLVHERIVDEETIQDVIKHAESDRDRALVMLFYYSGGRVTEVCSLRFRDIRGTNVIFTRTKGSKVRSVPIPTFVVDALKTLRQPGDKDDTFIFRSYRGRSLSRGTAYYIVRQITDAAATQMSPHWFRHAHASHTLDAGAPIHLVQKCLGHTNVATTSRYLHVKPDQGASRFLRQMV